MKNGRTRLTEQQEFFKITTNVLPKSTQHIPRNFEVVTPNLAAALSSGHSVANVSPMQKTLGVPFRRHYLLLYPSNLPFAVIPPDSHACVDTRRQREEYGITTQNKQSPLYFFSLEVPLGFHARKVHQLRETRVHPGM